MSVDDPSAEGWAALDALDRALAARPKRDGHAFSESTEHLCAMRDKMIAGAGTRAELGRLNAVISLVLAGHFPLGNTPWPEVEKARDALAQLIAEF